MPLEMFEVKYHTVLFDSFPRAIYGQGAVCVCVCDRERERERERKRVPLYTFLYGLMTQMCTDICLYVCKVHACMHARVCVCVPALVHACAVGLLEPAWSARR